MTKTQAEALRRALKKAFGGKVEYELIDRARGRYRFGIWSKRFNTVNHLDRQDQAWNVVAQTLTPEDALQVSLILTYAPADLKMATA